MKREMSLLFVPEYGPPMLADCDNGRIKKYEDFDVSAPAAWIEKGPTLNLVMVAQEAEEAPCKLVLVQQYRMTNLFMVDGPAEVRDLITSFGEQILASYSRTFRN